MIRYFIMAILLMPSLANAFSWADLWATSDQQGQALMNNKQFTEAKDYFTRQDWAATAAYRAGDYKQAAELFKEFNDEQGFYNLGNALAHLKKYEQALAAYTKALKLNPNNADAQYNYKLISELLKNDKKQNQDQKDKQQKNKDQQNQDQQNKDQQNQDQQDQQNKDQENKDQQDKQDNKKQDKKPAKNESKKQDQKDKTKKKSEAQTEAEQEQKQAKEQWLRLIPDDPGGLMREKFLRDHLRRERGWYQ